MAKVEQSIHIIPNPEGKPNNIRFSPKNLTRETLRELLGYQVSDKQHEVTIYFSIGSARLNIASSQINQVRQWEPDDQQEFLDKHTQLLKHSNKATIYKKPLKIAEKA